MIVPDAGRGNLQTLFDMIQKNSDSIAKLQETLQEITQEKSAISISAIDTNTWLRVQCTAKLKYDIMEELHSSAQNETVPAFEWDDSTERALSERLRPDTPRCEAFW